MTKRPIIGLLGEAGSGKDTAAEMLVAEHGFYSVALADPLKVYCGWLFGWQPEDLWADGSRKDTRDDRIPFQRCPHCGEPGGPATYPSEHGDQPLCHACGYRGNLYSEWQASLSPRYALQSLGGWGRKLQADVYPKLALERAFDALEGGHPCYDRFKEFMPESVLDKRYVNDKYHHVRVMGIVITDVRYRNEMEAIQQAGGRVVRITRAQQQSVTATGIPGHHSETEQQGIPDHDLDDHIFNDGTLDDLRNEVRRVVKEA